MRRNMSRIHRAPNYVKVIGHVWVHVDLLSPLIEKLPYSNLQLPFRLEYGKCSIKGDNKSTCTHTCPITLTKLGALWILDIFLHILCSYIFPFRLELCAFHFT